MAPTARDAGPVALPAPRAPLGVYVHVPFCAAICNYCNFNRGLFDADLKARFVDAVCREIRSSSAPARPADSIFFGGGTPSLLAPADVERILTRAATPSRWRLTPRSRWKRIPKA